MCFCFPGCFNTILDVISADLKFSFSSLHFFVVVSLGIIMTGFTLRLLVILYQIKLSTLRRQVYLNTNGRSNLTLKRNVTCVLTR